MPVIEPPALALFVCFMGPGLSILWFGFNVWKSQKWRMSGVPYACIAFAAICVLLLIICLPFYDPALMDGVKKELDFRAISVVCATLNVVLLLPVVFRQDKAYRFNLKYFLQCLSDTALAAQQETEQQAPATKAKMIDPSHALHSLLGEGYSIDPKAQAFQHAFPLNLAANSNVQLTAMDGGALSKLKELVHSPYAWSLVVLLVYLIIAAGETEYGSLAFLNCLAFLLLDTIHEAISRGRVQWSPGYAILLLVLGRLCITICGPAYWLFGYSAAFLVYGIALTRDVFALFMPLISEREAAEIAFSNKVGESNLNADISGTPEFCLGLLTFCFLAVLGAFMYSSNSSLPDGYISFWDSSWRMNVIGIVAFVLYVVAALGMLTRRAFYLSNNGLLKGWAREAYIWDKRISFPTFIAAVAELAILAGGLVLYGATGAASICVFAIFFPPIIGCLGFCWQVQIGC